MHVLLVNTNRMRPPVGPLALDYIGSALEDHGHDVALLDLCLEPDAAAAARHAFAASSFDLVAMTFRNTDDCYFASRASFIDQLAADVRLVRRHHAGPVVIGGSGFSVSAARILEDVGEEFGIRGDGEFALPALLDALAGQADMTTVPGLVFRSNGTWRENPACRGRLDTYPLPRRRTIDNARYFREGGQAGIETKRGCPETCTFCADPVIKGHHSRLRPPRSVVAELDDLLAQGIDHFHICDSEFNLPIQHAVAVCQAMASAGLGDHVHWYTYASPRPFTRQLLREMQRAGCAGINFGVDSANDEMLTRLGRGHTTRDVRDVAALCHEARMPFMFDLLLGGPGETWDSVAETIGLVQLADPTCVGLSLGLRVYPGTPLAERLARAGEDADGLEGDPASLQPAFYLAPALGDNALERLRALVADDPRFFLPAGDDQRDYNYNENSVLVDAIKAGRRGAYWAILSSLHG